MFRVGDVCEFTYRCWESEESKDVKLWHHTGQSVAILQRLTDVDEVDVGAMYRIQFADGFRESVFEDELSLNKGETNGGKLEFLCPFCGTNLEGKHNLMPYYLEHWPSLEFRCLHCDKVAMVSQMAKVAHSKYDSAGGMGHIPAGKNEGSA